jgi:hypothetical protein
MIISGFICQLQLSRERLLTNLLVSSRILLFVILDRRNKEWIDNIGEVRCHLYPVHNFQGKILPLLVIITTKINCSVIVNAHRKMR